MTPQFPHASHVTGTTASVTLSVVGAKMLTIVQDVLSCFTEYCKEVFNFISFCIRASSLQWISWIEWCVFNIIPITKCSQVSPQSVTYLPSSFISWNKTVIRNSDTAFGKHLIRISRDLSSMFVVYVFDAIVNVWSVFIVYCLTLLGCCPWKFMACSGDFLERFSPFHRPFSSVFCLSGTSWVFILELCLLSYSS